MLVLGLNLLQDLLKTKIYLNYAIITFSAALLLVGICAKTLTLCTMLVLVYAYCSRTLCNYKAYLNNGIFEQWYLYPINLDLMLLCEMTANFIIALATTMPFILVNMFIIEPHTNLISTAISAACLMSVFGLYYGIATANYHTKPLFISIMHILINTTLALIACALNNLTMQYRIYALIAVCITILCVYSLAKKKLLSKI